PNALAWQVFPSIAIAGDTAWVVWTESRTNPGFPEDDPGDGTVMAAYSAPGNTWAQARVVARGGVYASLRLLNSPDGGMVDVVWSDAAGDGAFGLQHATLDPRPAGAP
ncbi:MAG: hypothetical protein H7Y32_16065, partial [Chloroflexales bacterium]|nr:hypothetical protein [Chloroflexales bacterium]